MHEKFSQLVKTPKGEGRVVGYDEAGRYFVDIGSGVTAFFDKGEVFSPESDPTGKSAHEHGSKLDAGKTMAGVLEDFSLALLAVAEVGTYGAKKYSRGGWQGVDPVRYTDAKWRHLLAREERDEESGLLHEAQVVWNALAALELKLRGNTNDHVCQFNRDICGVCMVCGSKSEPLPFGVCG